MNHVPLDTSDRQALAAACFIAMNDATRRFDAPDLATRQQAHLDYFRYEDLRSKLFYIVPEIPDEVKDEQA